MPPNANARAARSHPRPPAPRPRMEGPGILMLLVLSLLLMLLIFPSPSLHCCLWSRSRAHSSHPLMTQKPKIVEAFAVRIGAELVRQSPKERPCRNGGWPLLSSPQYHRCHAASVVMDTCCTVTGSLPRLNILNMAQWSRTMAQWSRAEKELIRVVLSSRQPGQTCGSKFPRCSI